MQLSSLYSILPVLLAVICNAAVHSHLHWSVNHINLSIYAAATGSNADESEMYVIGGENKTQGFSQFVYIYNGNNMTNLSVPVPAPVGTIRCMTQCSTTIDQYIYIVTGSREIYIFDTNNKIYNPSIVLNDYMLYAQSCLTDNQTHLFLVGMLYPYPEIGQQIAIYDIKYGGNWEFTYNRTDIIEGGCIYYKQHLFYFGGQKTTERGGCCEPTDSIIDCNLMTDVCSIYQNHKLIQPRWYLRAVMPYNDGVVYLIAGLVNNKHSKPEHSNLVEICVISDDGTILSISNDSSSNLLFGRAFASVGFLKPEQKINVFGGLQYNRNGSPGPIIAISEESNIIIAPIQSKQYNYTWLIILIIVIVFVICCLVVATVVYWKKMRNEVYMLQCETSSLIAK